MSRLPIASKSVLFLVSVFLKINLTFSQVCNCTETLRILQTKIEANYAGYEDKVNKKTVEKYKELVTGLQQKSKSLSNSKECQILLEGYIAFFKDPHLQIEDQYTTENIEVQTKQLPNENMVLYFQNLTLSENDIRGIWKNDTYEIAIISSNKADCFDAMVISSENKEWKKGMLKMQLQKAGNNLYKINYTTGSFEAFETKGYFANNILDILSVGVFEKTTPRVPGELDAKTYKSIFPDEEVKFTFPNDTTAVLFIGSFRNALEAVVDSLMIKHKTDLEKRPYWIIDISYNGGGGTGTYKTLLPYINTSKIKRSGSFYRLSKENTQKIEQFINDNPNLPVAVNSFFSTLITTGKKKPDSWYFEKGKVFIADQTIKNPIQIGVLVSGKTASSGEIFMLDAKQSKKVTVFGTQTVGMVDYGDGFVYTVGCDNIKILIPSRKSEYLNRIQYDNIGLTPDVKISEENIRPYDFIMEYFKGKRNKK